MIMTHYIDKSALVAFELGLRVNNPITAADRGMAEEIINNLKRVEQDYHIDLTKYMEWLRNKTQKGEPVSRTPADIEAAMQEVKEKSRAFTEAHQGECADTILAQMRGEEPVSNDLEEAASLYVADDKLKPWRNLTKEAFKAGAKWQKQQLMTKAIDMIVGYWMPNGLRLDVDETENPYNIDEGNKVKLIIIKDE